MRFDLSNKEKILLNHIIGIRRTELELTQEELADKICDATYISKLERNNQFADYEIYYKVIQKLGFKLNLGEHEYDFFILSNITEEFIKYNYENVLELIAQVNFNREDIFNYSVNRFLLFIKLFILEGEVVDTRIINYLSYYMLIDTNICQAIKYIFFEYLRNTVNQEECFKLVEQYKLNEGTNFLTKINQAILLLSQNKINESLTLCNDLIKEIPDSCCNRILEISLTKITCLYNIHRDELYDYLEQVNSFIKRYESKLRKNLIQVYYEKSCTLLYLMKNYERTISIIEEYDAINNLDNPCIKLCIIYNLSLVHLKNSNMQKFIDITNNNSSLINTVYLLQKMCYDYQYNYLAVEEVENYIDDILRKYRYLDVSNFLERCLVEIIDMFIKFSKKYYITKKLERRLK